MYISIDNRTTRQKKQRTALKVGQATVAGVGVSEAGCVVKVSVFCLAFTRNSRVCTHRGGK